MSSKKPARRTAQKTMGKAAQATTTKATSSKKHQSKVGRPVQPRGQQMGDERSAPDKSQQAKENTPALRGRRQDANKFFADNSSQHLGSSGDAPSDNSPSVPAAIPIGEKLGESGGEKVFKKRQAAKRRSSAKG